MDEYRQEIEKFLKEQTNKAEINLEVPPNPELGDYAFACFSLARDFRKSPAEIAMQIASKFKSEGTISRATAVGPYVNFFIEPRKRAERTIKKALKEKELYGSSDEGCGKKVVLEHTSINPNASPHVGRARNAFIGDSIARTLRFQGFDIKSHFYVNDVGKQIAMLVIGSEGREKIDFESLLKIYIDINERAEKDASVEKQAFDLLYRLEGGDKEIREKFRRIVDVCIQGQKRIFMELGIEFDFFDYESKYLFDKKTDAVLKQLENTGKLFTDEENRLVLNQEGFGLSIKCPVLVLTRSDRTSLYGLRDIAYTIDKSTAGRNIIVLGEDQKLYFEQISAALKIIGKEAPVAVHYSFVLLEEGKMSTRKGNLVLLEDFMKESLRKAKEEIKARHGTFDEDTAKAIAYGAIKYAILRVSPEKNVMFTWEQALSFEGESGPYIQYSYARICSILKKCDSTPGNDVDYSLLSSKEEIELVKKVALFPDVVKKMSDELRPHLVASYAYELSKKFSEFYHCCPVLQEDENLKKARLALIISVKHAIKNSMQLLGINVPEQM